MAGAIQSSSISAPPNQHWNKQRAILNLGPLFFYQSVQLSYSYFAAIPETCSTSCVPLSNLTLLLAELMMEACVAPLDAVFNATPGIPTTPLLVLFSAPAAAEPLLLILPFTVPAEELAVEP